MNKSLTIVVLALGLLSLVHAAPKPKPNPNPHPKPNPHPNPKPKPDLSENPVPAAVAAVDTASLVNAPQVQPASGVALNPVENSDVDLTSAAKQKRQDEAAPAADAAAGGDAAAAGGEGHKAADEKERKGTKSTAGLVRKSAQHNVVAWPTGLGYVRGSRPLNRFMQG